MSQFRLSESENQNLIKNIIPKLEGIGWQKREMFFEESCSAGRIDLLYKIKGRNVAIVEIKKQGVGKNGALEQAVKYAEATKTPLAVATDGATYLETLHLRNKQPLKDYEGNNFNINSFSLLSHSNLLFLQGKNNSLQVRVKTQDQVINIFKKLDSLGRDVGLTVGVERVLEIAKIIFIKMLCDNNIILEQNDWE